MIHLSAAQNICLSLTKTILRKYTWLFVAWGADVKRHETEVVYSSFSHSLFCIVLRISEQAGNICVKWYAWKRLTLKLICSKQTFRLLYNQWPTGLYFNWNLFFFNRKGTSVLWKCRAAWGGSRRKLANQSAPLLPLYARHQQHIQKHRQGWKVPDARLLGCKVGRQAALTDLMRHVSSDKTPCPCSWSGCTALSLILHQGVERKRSLLGGFLKYQIFQWFFIGGVYVPLCWMHNDLLLCVLV